MALKLNKHKLHKSVRNGIISTRPELLHKLTTEKFDKALIHAGGFLSCFTIMSEPPIREKEVEDMIVGEMVKFVIDEKTEH